MLVVASLLVGLDVLQTFSDLIFVDSKLFEVGFLPLIELITSCDDVGVQTLQLVLFLVLNTLLHLI
jgi:hypothetical protein